MCQSSSNIMMVALVMTGGGDDDGDVIAADGDAGCVDCEYADDTDGDDGAHADASVGDGRV